MNDHFGRLALRGALGVVWMTNASLGNPILGGTQGTEHPETPEGLVLAVMQGVLAAMILLGIRGREASLALLPFVAAGLTVHTLQGCWESMAVLLFATLAHVLLGDGDIAVVPEQPLVPPRRPASA